MACYSSFWLGIAPVVAVERRANRGHDPRDRAVTLLGTFTLTPRELSSALDISITHASNILRRLWERGVCERWPYRDRSYRYRLRATCVAIDGL